MDQIMEFITNHWMLSGGFAAVAFMLIGLEIRIRLQGALWVKPQELVMLMNHEGAVLYDLRSLEQYKAGHILHSKHATLSELESKLNTLDKIKTKHLVFISESSVHGTPVSNQILQKGIFVKQLEGGIEAWKEAGLPLQKGS